MTLNNWLCKHFDREKKGYVEVGDVITLIVWCLATVAGGLFIFIGIGSVAFAINPNLSIYDKSSNPMPSTNQWILISIYGWWNIIRYIIIPAAIIIGIALVYLKLSEVKIAKCERKQEEEK